ncbi:hypothetical protein [Streptomyces griseosporeus]
MKKADARRVTSDWAELFPELTVWKPLRLLRRIGPVLQGITLDRSTSGEQYYPTAHVHALTRDFPVVSLSLAHYQHQPLTAKEAVDIGRHAETFRAVAGRTEERSPLPLRRRPDIAEIVQAYRAAAVAAQRGRRIPTGIPELEDMVLVPAAAGERPLAEESLDRVRQIADGWSKYEAAMGWTDAQEWLAHLEERAGDAAGLAATVEEQIVQHGLAKVRAESGPGMMAP